MTEDVQYRQIEIAGAYDVGSMALQTGATTRKKNGIYEGFSTIIE